jgi:hypothetical protein
MALTLHYKSSAGNVLDYTVNNGSKIYSRATKKDGTFTHDGFVFQFNDDEKAIYMVLESAVAARPLQPLESEFTINQRFGFLEKFTNMVLDGETVSAIVTGEGGLGKSHTIMGALEKRGWQEGTQYVVVKGYATPKALYGTLWEHRDKTIIFDDCDSVLKDAVSLNLLKGALDSYDKRTISWLQKGFIDDNLPNSFEFQGNIIFISNMSSDKLDQAVKSRSMTIDLSMTLKDKIERMNYILPSVMPCYPMDMKQTALDFMAQHADIAKEFNMRTLQKIIKITHAYGDNPEWKDAAKYLITNI